MTKLLSELIDQFENKKDAGIDDPLIRALIKENRFLDRCRLALEHLTPGGSEYYRDPDLCAKYIRETRDHYFNKMKKEIVKRKELEKELEKGNLQKKAQFRIIQEDMKSQNFKRAYLFVCEVLKND